MQELLLQEYDFDVDATESIYSTCSFQTKESSYRQADDEKCTDQANFCRYHRIVGHTTKECYVLKDLIQDMVKSGALFLEKEERKVTTNMVSIQFGQFQPCTIPVTQEEPHDVEFRIERGFVVLWISSPPSASVSV